MSRLYLGVIIFITSLLSIFYLASAQAQENSTVSVSNTTIYPKIITAVPPPKENIVIPEGYLGCFTVPAGWSKDNIWVPERKVCQYAPGSSPSVQGDAWIESYWACIQYKGTEPDKGNCISWEWRPGHWIKTFPVY
jgi:hypothetical protein